MHTIPPSLPLFKVLPREKELGRRYDWVMRLRWDLAWLRPPPPLATLRRDAVSLSYAFWPISDQAAIMPRHLAQVAVFVCLFACVWVVVRSL